MLAVRLERDVLQEDDLVVAADLLERSAEVDGRVFLIAARIFAPCTGDPPRGVEKTFAVWIVARPANERADRLLDLPRDVRSLLGIDEIAVFGLSMFEGRVHSLSSRAMSSATDAACSRISGTAVISQ